MCYIVTLWNESLRFYYFRFSLFIYIYRGPLYSKAYREGHHLRRHIDYSGLEGTKGGESVPRHNPAAAYMRSSSALLVSKVHQSLLRRDLWSCVTLPALTWAPPVEHSKFCVEGNTLLCSSPCRSGGVAVCLCGFRGYSRILAFSSGHS